MLFLMILLIFPIAGHVTHKNAGSTLFFNLKSKEDCWSKDDIAKLRARRSFEDLIRPYPRAPERITTKYIKETLKYYRTALKRVEQTKNRHTAFILKQALSDTIGAHLRSDFLPTVRFAYYAGYVPYRHAKQAHDFYERIKHDLNTQGLGWKIPPRIPQWSNLTVAKILIGNGKYQDPCACLIKKRDANSCIHLPPPTLDDDTLPSAVVLPFKTDGLVSLSSPRAENILLKYYTTASRCILHSSPRNCRHSDFVNFNNDLWLWMKRDVAPHLVDEKLYAAYGGVLRIAAAVQNYGKGLSRRNLYEEQQTPGKWIPWKSLMNARIVIDADWTPRLYIGLVFVAALAICLLQLCYNYVFGEESGCLCRRTWKKEDSLSIIGHADVQTSSPLIQSQLINFMEKMPNRSFPSKTKSLSLGSIQTQKVYDLNENTEKLMAVIVSADEESESESSKDSSDEKSVTAATRPRSPPKIETSMAQLTIDKTSGTSKRTSFPLYSTSTLTRTDVTYREGQRLSESAWSATGSSTSSRSSSSDSSRTSCRSRSSRDLAWARHVISKNSAKSLKSSSRTDLNVVSYMQTSK